MADDKQVVQAIERLLKPLERLLETTQDVSILQALEAGMTIRTVKSLLSVDTDRVTRVSKLRPKKADKRNSKGSEE